MNRANNFDGILKLIGDGFRASQIAMKPGPKLSLRCPVTRINFFLIHEIEALFDIPIQIVIAPDMIASKHLCIHNCVDGNTNGLPRYALSQQVIPRTIGRRKVQRG